MKPKLRKQLERSYQQDDEESASFLIQLDSFYLSDGFISPAIESVRVSAELNWITRRLVAAAAASRVELKLSLAGAKQTPFA